MDCCQHSADQEQHTICSPLARVCCGGSAISHSSEIVSTLQWFHQSGKAISRRYSGRASRATRCDILWSLLLSVISHALPEAQRGPHDSLACKEVLPELASVDFPSLWHLRPDRCARQRAGKEPRASTALHSHTRATCHPGGIGKRPPARDG